MNVNITKLIYDFSQLINIIIDVVLNIFNKIAPIFVNQESGALTLVGYVLLISFILSIVGWVFNLFIKIKGGATHEEKDS